MTVGGITSTVLTTIEKRFQFTSKETGFIAASNDISAILLTFIVSYCGGYGNKSRWLGYGALITGEVLDFDAFLRIHAMCILLAELLFPSIFAVVTNVFSCLIYVNHQKAKNQGSKAE